MTPIELLRELMAYDKTISDYKLVALVFEELTAAQAELRVLQLMNYPTIIVPKGPEIKF